MPSESSSIGKDWHNSGYDVLPSGLILQWMPFSQTGGNYTHYYPIPFPHKVLCVQFSGTTGAYEDSGIRTNDLYEMDKEKVTIWACYGDSGFIFAIGY